MASLSVSTRKIGPLTVRSTGGTDGKGGGDGPAIVLSHGFGAPGDDLVSLAGALDEGPLAGKLRWFFPEAPGEVDFGGGQKGREWWHIDMLKIQQAMISGQRMKIIEETPVGLAEARAALEGCLDSLDLDPARTIIGGFSQGAMLSTEVQIHRDAPYAGLAVLSGSLLSVDRWSPAIAERAAKLHVFQSHGQRDPIIPFDAAVALRNLLQAHGADLEFVAFAGQHEIPRVVLQGLGRFVQKILG